MGKEILIISNYFPPEQGAAANRIQALANELKRRSYKVAVICPLPNYPKGKVFPGFKGKLSHKEQNGNLTIHRLWLLASNSQNKFVRLFSMLSFAFSLSLFLLFKKSPKKVIIQCSPLFVGYAGVFFSKLKGKKVILNVSDLWPLAGLEMELLNQGTYYTILEKIERFNYKKSDLVLGQSHEILRYVNQIFPEKKTVLYRNYPDFDIPESNSHFTSALHRAGLPSVTNSKEIKIVYAGLLGIAQGLYEICKQIALPANISLHIYGDGPEAKQIEDLSVKNSQIVFHGMIDRTELHQVLGNYDMTLVPLANRIYGSVPSKIFEYSRLGLPILYFSEGEGAELVKKHQLGWSISDFEKLNVFLSQLSKNEILLPERAAIITTVKEKFNFKKQFDEIIQVIESC